VHKTDAITTDRKNKPDTTSECIIFIYNVYLRSDYTFRPSSLDYHQVISMYPYILVLVRRMEVVCVGVSGLPRPASLVEGSFGH
jgi:hypothetical protein